MSRRRRQGSRGSTGKRDVSNAAGRLLYDKVAKHEGFIVYEQDL